MGYLLIVYDGAPVDLNLVYVTPKTRIILFKFVLFNTYFVNNRGCIFKTHYTFV